MKSCFSIILFIIFTSITPIFAQTFTVSGTIKAEDSTPMEFANVVLVSNDENKVTGTVSDGNGKFEISILPNTYTFSVSFIGYQTHTAEITIDRNIDLGAILLKTDAQMLEGVTVIAQRPLFERKVDRFVFNVESAAAVTGGNAIDALRITPGVRVGVNDGISMIGRGDFIVTIDDRILPLSGEQLIAYLRNIPTGNIQSIEIITNPPAKYAAEGNAGVINIVMKRNPMDSWNLSFSASCQAHTYMEILPVINSGIDFNYRQNKLSLFASASVFRGSIIAFGENKIYYPTETWAQENPRRYGEWSSFGGNLGFDYRITDFWQIGGTYNNWNSRNPSVTNNPVTTIYDNANGQIKAIHRTANYRDGAYQMHNANLNTIIKIDTIGKRLSVDFDYFRGTTDELRRFTNDTYDANANLVPNSHIGNENTTDGIATNYAVRVGVELPTPWVDLNVGGRIAFTKQESDFCFYNTTIGSPILDTTQSNLFNFRENTQAVFISARKEISKKFHLQAGLRMEHTATEGYSQTIAQKNRNSYTSFFPTLYFLYRFNDTRALSLTYGRRINRPQFYWLNPFRTYQNPYEFTEGNPFLQPVFANNLDLSFTSSSFEHRVWFTHIAGDIAFFPVINESTHTVRYAPMNFINYFSLGFSETAHFNPFWWWSSHNNVVIYYIQKNSIMPETQPRIETISSNLSSNNDFIFNRSRTLVLNIGIYYEFPYIEGFGRTDGYFNLDGAIRANLMNNNLILALTAKDILGTRNFSGRMESNGIRTISNSRRENRFVGLSITYKIGNQNIWTQRRAKSEEQERLGK
jgi:hypothetical protein